MKISIPPQQLAVWIQTFVPELDLFFLEDSDLAIYKTDLAAVLVVPREEFMAHPLYRRLELANSYQYWNIAEQLSHVIVAQPEWIERMPPEKKSRLLKSQAESGRGLLFPAALLPGVPADSIVELDGADVVVLQSSYWQRLALPVKERFLAAYALEWDTADCHPFPKSAPLHLQGFANRYSAAHGSNCLSATLFAISGQAWIAHEWVHPETFLQGLRQYGYKPYEKEAENGDVVIWANAEGTVQHASYCLGDGLYFNKNGQTFFNPWKVIDRVELDREWAHFDHTVYSAT